MFCKDQKVRVSIPHRNDVRFGKSLKLVLHLNNNRYGNNHFLRLIFVVVGGSKVFHATRKFLTVSTSTKFVSVYNREKVYDPMISSKSCISILHFANNRYGSRHSLMFIFAVEILHVTKNSMYSFQHQKVGICIQQRSDV